MRALPNTSKDTKMKRLASQASGEFERAIARYHAQPELDPSFPEAPKDLDGHFFAKAWIDTVQWHLEDEIRRMDLSGPEVLSLKRRIDSLNQARTDAVEAMDHLLQAQLSPEIREVVPSLRTESLGWALDRLSILHLKRFHMRVEVERGGRAAERANPRLIVLNQQLEHLGLAIDSLVDDLVSGAVRYVRYEQHKLYNDPDTNPALYHVK